MKGVPFTKDDLKWILVIKPDDWTDFTSAFEWYIENENCHPVKFEENGQLLSVGSVIMNEDSAWLGHIITHKEHRKKGLGTKMTMALVDIARNAGKSSVFLIATDMGLPVYLKCGFVIDSKYHGYNRPEEFQPFEISKNIRTFEQKDLDGLLALDRAVSGEGRSHLLNDNLEGAMVYDKDTHHEGYFLPKLGDGMIIASSDQAGLGLMQYRLNEVKHAITPVANTTAIDFLQDNKFVYTKHYTRMYLGEKRNWQPQNLFNRIGGHLG
ncbi:MAG: GNAT family N-acetyltransferase [Bacteroidota bacterium]